MRKMGGGDSHCRITAVALLVLALGGCSYVAPRPVPSPAPTVALVPLPAYVRQFGSAYWDRANGVAVDRAGNIVVAGATLGALPGNTQTGGAYDAFVRKLSPEGIELWTRQFGSSAADGALAVGVNGTGNIIVAGHTEATLPGQTSAGGEDAFVRKLSPEGAELWMRQFGSPNSDAATGVAVDGAGDIILAGNMDGPRIGQLGNQDAFVWKLSPEGIELWMRQFGSSAWDRVTGVAVDKAGNIFVVGDTYGALPGQTPAGGRDAFVEKLSPEGTELWRRQFGSSASDGALAVAVDGAGNIFVAGDTEGTLPGQTPAGGRDAFVEKLSPEGIDLWRCQFGSSASDGALAVAADRAGNIFVAGHTEGTLQGQTLAGDDDAFVRKLSPEGIELWTQQFGSSASDLAIGVTVDGAGNVIVVGATSGTLPGQTPAGGKDAFVTRLKQPAPP